MFTSTLRLASNSNDALKESCSLRGTGYRRGLRVQQCTEMFHFTYDNSSEKVRMARPASLGRFMQGVNPNSQIQGADWCSAPALSTQLQHLKYVWILPSSVHKPQERAIKTVFTCMLCSLSFWALGVGKKLSGSKLFSDLTFLLKRLGYLALRPYSPFPLPPPPPTHPSNPTRSTWKGNHTIAASHRLLVSFWSHLCIITVSSPSWRTIKTVN